jgi:hypothetical protein
VLIILGVLFTMEILAELRKDLTDFCSTTSIQGMRYLSDPNYGSISRFIWFLIVVVSFTLSGICIRESFDGNYIIISFHITNILIFELILKVVQLFSMIT